MSEAQKAVALVIYNNVVRESGKDCVVEYFSAGTVASPAARVIENDGSLSGKILGGGAATLEWHRLRNNMAEHSGRGAWFSATLHVTVDGRYSFDYDYDKRTELAYPTGRRDVHRRPREVPTPRRPDPDMAPPPPVATIGVMMWVHGAAKRARG